MHPVVEHVATRALTLELHGNLVVLASTHVLDVALRVRFDIVRDLSWRADVARISRVLRQLRNADTLLHVRHDLQVDAIVDEWELTGIHHLFFHSHPHVGLT